MVLNSVDALGQAYVRQLAQCGFDVVFCGPPADLIRMNEQALVIEQDYGRKTKVLVLDYDRTNQSEMGREVLEQLREDIKDLEVCIFINNQTNTIPIELACKDLLDTSVQACMKQIAKHINCQILTSEVILPKLLERIQDKDQSKSQSKNKKSRKISSALLTLKSKS